MFRFDTRSQTLDMLKRFESEYEDAMQETDANLTYLGFAGHNMVLWDDGEPVAHTVGISVARMPGEADEDSKPWNDLKFNTECLYIYSTTVRADFQGKGLGKLLCAYYAGYKKAQGFKTLIGHATSPAMVAVRQWMGASFGPVHANWCASERKAHFYVQQL